MRLVRPSGSLAGPDPGDRVALTPREAGWSWTGLRVVALEPGVPRTVETGGFEVFVLPLSGDLSLRVSPAEAPTAPEAGYELAGRTSVFSSVTDVAYAGRDSVLTLTSEAGAEVALPSAVCGSRRPPSTSRRPTCRWRSAAPGRPPGR